METSDSGVPPDPTDAVAAERGVSSVFPPALRSLGRPTDIAKQERRVPRQGGNER